MDWFRHTILKIVVAACFSAVLPSKSYGYPTPVDFTGKLQRWPIQREAPRVTWEAQSDDDIGLVTYKELVREAAEIWSNVASSYVVVEAASPSETAMITIHYDSSIVGGETSAGYAEFDSTDSHGPVHCTIHIAAPADVDIGGLAKTTLHEMGHCLGLGHSVVPESIMSYRLDKNNFGLALDDEAAVSRLYPADGSSPRKPVGCSIGSSPRRAGSFKFLCFLLVFGPFFIVMKRRIRG